MIDTVNMLINSIVEWKMGYNVIHVTNSISGLHGLITLEFSNKMK